LFIVFPRPLSEQDCRAFAFFARRSSDDFPNVLDEPAKIRLLIQYEAHLPSSLMRVGGEAPRCFAQKVAERRVVLADSANSPKSPPLAIEWTPVEAILRAATMSRGKGRFLPRKKGRRFPENTRQKLPDSGNGGNPISDKSGYASRASCPRITYFQPFSSIRVPRAENSAPSVSGEDS
jgi:hypothetical protein